MFNSNPQVQEWQFFIMISIIEFVKVDNKAVKAAVKKLIMAKGNNLINADVNAMKAELHNLFGLKEHQHIDVVQIQNAINYFRFAKSQQKLRETYNFND